MQTETAQAATTTTSDQASQTASTAGGAPTTQAAETRNAADLEREIAELRRENAKHRTENNSLRTFKEQQEASTLSETEKANKAKTDAEARATTLEAQLKETRLRGDIERAARKLSIQDEDAAYRLLDLDQVTFDDAGKPTNIEKLLSDLAKAKPYLVAASGSGGSPANPNRGGAPVFTTTQIADRQFYVKNKAEIEKAYRENRIVEG